MVGQMHDDPVEAVRDRRAGRAAGGVVWPEHEVVDEELRAPAEEVRQRGAPLVGLEAIRPVDLHPRQVLPPPRQLVAAPRELLLRREQLEPRGEPLCTCPGLVLRHRSGLLPSGVLPCIPFCRMCDRRPAPPRHPPRRSGLPLLDPILVLSTGACMTPSSDMNSDTIS